MAGKSYGQIAFESFEKTMSELHDIGLWKPQRWENAEKKIQQGWEVAAKKVAQRVIIDIQLKDLMTDE